MTRVKDSNLDTGFLFLITKIQRSSCGFLFLFASSAKIRLFRPIRVLLHQYFNNPLHRPVDLILRNDERRRKANDGVVRFLAKDPFLQ